MVGAAEFHFLSLTVMLYLFLALALVTALLAMDTARRVRNMLAPAPVVAR